MNNINLRNGRPVKFALTISVVLAALVCNAQSPTVDVVQHDVDVLDVFAIGDTAVVYLYSDLPTRATAIESIDRIMPVDRAVTFGRLNMHSRALVDFSLGQPHRAELCKVSATKHFDSGFLWSANWNLWPKQGGFSGIPYQYRIYLRPNGQQIEPRLFLTDFVPLHRRGEGDLVFSTMPFSDANEERPGGVASGDARSIATRVANAFVAEHRTEGRNFRLDYHNQASIELPVGIDKGKSVSKRKLWAIEFAATLNNDEKVPNNKLTIWITGAGISSALTLNVWQHEPRKRVK